MPHLPELIARVLAIMEEEHKQYFSKRFDYRKMVSLTVAQQQLLDDTLSRYPEVTGVYNSGSPQG